MQKLADHGHDFKQLILMTAERAGFNPKLLEKDYYMTMIVNNIENLSTNLVLRGSVALNKIYLNNNRLSDDLDFFLYFDTHLNQVSLCEQEMTLIRGNIKSYLKGLNLRIKNPYGEKKYNSKLYIFYAQYHSLVTGLDEEIRIDISTNFMMDQPRKAVLKHLYEEKMPFREVLSLSLDELVAGKLHAVLAHRRCQDARVRDYLDFWCIDRAGFDFYQDKFVNLLRIKFLKCGYRGPYQKSKALRSDCFDGFHERIQDSLSDVIREDELFEYDLIYKRLVEILEDKRLHWRWVDYLRVLIKGYCLDLQSNI